jgi:hypothetical protein
MQPETTQRRSIDRQSSHLERRLGARASVEMPVDVLVDGLLYRCSIVEISPSGVLLELTATLAVREPHLVGLYDIHAGARGTLRVTARTVWRHATTQAARFVAVPEHERSAILELVRTARWCAASDVQRLEMAEQQDWLASRRRHAA